MRVDKFTYAQVEACLYEAMRTYIKGGKVQADREGNALLDVNMTKYNETYVHDCLKPIKDEPAKRKKTKDGTKYYRKNEDGILVEYQRGQAIANYHNSQVKSKLQKARMTGDTIQLSKAIGFIITLPKDYIQGVIPDLSDAEYEYLVSKTEAEQMHQPFKIDELYEKTLDEKFSRHKWTKEEMEKAKEFLFAAKDCVLEEMGIRNEDVLFYSLHWDESFPHIHAMALCTQEKTYEEDVYSKKKKKDGTYTLLHKKGETEISYSVGKLYEQNKEGKYTFFKDFHQNVVDRMAVKGMDASGLINGVTSERKFNPAQMNYEQREESVKQSMKILALQKKMKQLETKISVFESEIESTTKQLEEIQEELTIAISEKQIAEEKVANATRELEELQDTLEEKDIELEEINSQVDSLKDIIKELKTELANLVKEVALFVPNIIKAFIKGWKEAKTEVQMEKIDTQAKEKAIMGANRMTEHLQDIGNRAQTLLEEEVVSGIKMTTFERTNKKVELARKQILKVAEVAGVAKVFKENPALIEIALEDWFDDNKYRKKLKEMSDVDAYLFMKASYRAERAVEYTLINKEEIDKYMEID